MVLLLLTFCLLLLPLWESVIVLFCSTLLYVHSSIAIILMGKRELIALLNLSSWCLVNVERLFLAVPRGCLQFVIVVFPDHTHLLFLIWFQTVCKSYQQRTLGGKELTAFSKNSFRSTFSKWRWIDTKSIITSYSLVWRVNQLSKLINRIPGSSLLISSLPGLASRMHVKSLCKPCNVNKCSLKALPGKLDIKRHSPSILYIYCHLLIFWIIKMWK